MCQNLARYGPMQEPVIVWNRTISKAERLAETSDKLVAARSLADAVAAADIVCICLIDDAAVDSTIDMAKAQTSVSGKVFVDMSTVHPDTNQAQSEKLAKVDAAYLACPSTLSWSFCTASAYIRSLWGRGHGYREANHHGPGWFIGGHYQV